MGKSHLSRTVQQEQESLTQAILYWDEGHFLVQRGQKTSTYLTRSASTFTLCPQYCTWILMTKTETNRISIGDITYLNIHVFILNRLYFYRLFLVCRHYCTLGVLLHSYMAGPRCSDWKHFQKTILIGFQTTYRFMKNRFHGFILVRYTKKK